MLDIILTLDNEGGGGEGVKCARGRGEVGVGVQEPLGTFTSWFGVMPAV